jgi:two-component system chemotaxis sensor kinase CheA
VADYQRDLIREFVVESYENLEQLDGDLLMLEQGEAPDATVSRIFRTIHTIKGTCGFFGFGKLETITHVGENLLSKLRDKRIQLLPSMTSALLELVDAIREVLARIEADGGEGDSDYSELTQTLTRLLETESGDICSEASRVGAAGGRITTPGPAEIAKAETKHSTATPADGTIRVNVGLLDKLMNGVGELVLARNQMLQFAGTIKDGAFLGTSQRLSLITSELQESVMKTRMQPIGSVWNKFSRVVRDLALQCGKQVRLEMEGRLTELDKTILEAIKDPLTHLVRNAVDHGIEPPEQRLSAGKSAEGCLKLRAFHEGGQVHIEIADDGGGLNLERIRQKAVERGLLAEDLSRRLSERDLAQLIFTPGFSTADQVSNVSGRGVGLDVVKINVEKIGGTVDLQTRSGLGTSINIKIPLTLAIISALIVVCGGDRYAIPQAGLLELVRLDGDQAEQRIERLHHAPVLRLRSQLLPIVDLRCELGLLDGQEDANEAIAGRGQRTIVVLQADQRQFGLLVDSVRDTQEIVVKPLCDQLKCVPAFAGATIMGDGRVALILDVLGIAQRARVISDVRKRLSPEAGKESNSKRIASQLLLLVDAGDRRIGLPVSSIARLEELPCSAVEYADGREVVQHRGEILTLLRLNELCGAKSNNSPEAALRIVVCRHHGRMYGFVVDRIGDVVDIALETPDRASHGQGSKMAIIQNRVTNVLDVTQVLHDQAWRTCNGQTAQGVIA